VRSHATPPHTAANQALGTLQGPASAILQHALPASPASPTVQDSTLRLEMNALEEQALLEAHVVARSHQARLRQRYPVLWATFVSTTRCRCPSAFLPPTSPQQCGCKKHALDVYGDHTFTCTAHSGATKAHDWMVSVLGPLFRMAGHTVRTQHGVTASAGQRRGDVEIRNFLRDQAGSRSLVFDLALPTTGLGQAATCSKMACCCAA
jgi:hypothetical protein